MSEPQVVVYGASGYTGKLIAEFLARRGIDFVAAGRSAERLEAEMATVPGLDRNRCRIRGVAHEQRALAALFKGCKLVINVTGPFMQLGEPVVAAALEAGCHYLDTTGEQDWLLHVRDHFGPKFAAQGLLACPATSFMWLAGQLAVEELLLKEGIDSFDIVYAPNGAPTVASTLSFLRMCTRPQYLLLNGELATWPEASSIQVSAPHTHEILTGLPWGGGCEPIWYANDRRVRNLRVCVAFTPSPFVGWVLDRMQEYARVATSLSPEQQEELTNAWGREIATTPPREDEDVNRCTISVRARGRLAGCNLTYYATSPYLQTGAMIATAAQCLLEGSFHGAGVASPAAACGHHTFIDSLHREGLHCTLADAVWR